MEQRYDTQAGGGGDLGRALCIVTGSSKGFGRSIARGISRLLRPGSVLLLAARSAADLRSLEAELGQGSGGGLRVVCVPADLSLPSGLQELLRAAREAAGPDLDHVLLFNNAASLGDVSRSCSSFTELSAVDSYLSFNVSSPLCLTAGVLQAFPPRAGLRRSVVNISSLCAVQPFPSWGLYCTGKAAREMMFRVLAEEEPGVRVLSYCPGPLDTDMQELARTKTADPYLRKSFADMFADGKLLSCEESCRKLLALLLDDTFASGARVDVYDL